MNETSAGGDAAFGLDALDDAILKATSAIARLVGSDDGASTVEQIFGGGSALDQEIDAWRQGPIPFPDIRIVAPSVLPDADGAYVATDDAILVSEALFDATGAARSESRLVDVLLEEFGHRVDAVVNQADTAGDEGLAFAAAARGEPAPIAATGGGVDRGTVTIDGVAVEAEFATSVSDSGGFEGSSQTLQLESTDGGTLTYRYEHFTIPDRFIIRYEGQTLLDTGFTGGSERGTIEIPAGTSDQIEVRVVTDDAGTAWNYDVTAVPCADVTPLVVTSLGAPFERNADTGQCETDATVTVGRIDGTDPLLRAENGSAAYDRNSISLSNAVFFAAVGGVTDSLFEGSVSLDTGSRSGSISETGDGTFQLAGLDTDFNEVTVLSERLAFDVTFRLPDQATGIVVDTVSIVDDALIIDENGARFALGGRLSLPDIVEFRLLDVVDVEASDISIEYRAAEDAIRLQSKITFEGFAKTVGGIDSIEADLSGSNFLQINSDVDVDLVGSLTVSRELAAPRGWGLTEIELTIDTTTGEVGGSATLRTPFGVKFGEGAEVKPTLEFLASPFQLDAVGLEIDNLNKPIPAYPAFFFQRIGGMVDNFAPDNPNDIEFSGGIGATLGPQIQGTRLARLDLDGRITATEIEGTSDLDILTAEFSAFGEDLGTFTLITATGTTTLNWSDGFLQQTGAINVLDGFIQTNTSVKFDKDFNFSTGGSAAVGVPDFVPVFGGVPLANANYAIRFTNDGSFANDFAAGWGQVTIRELGVEVDITTGLRVNFDGSIERIGAGNIPETGSWQVEPGEAYVLFSARWENADPDAELVVTLPDGTRIGEDAFAANNIAVVDELSSATQRTIIALTPDAGLWDIELVDPAGLGTITTEALTETEGPTFRFTDQPLVADGNTVTIDYEAFDSDSDAEISFWYDDDPAQPDGLLIGTASEADGAGSFVWDTATVAPGDYFVYALVDDGQNPTLITFTDEAVSVAGSTADLSATIAASATEIVGGETVRFTVGAENLSADTARGVTLLVTIPEGSTLTASSVTPTSVNGTELTFDIGDLAAAGVTTIDLDVATPDVADTATLSADVLVLADTVDPEPGNDTAFIDVLTQPADPAEVDLSVAVDDLPATLSVGDAFGYTVVVTNNGPDDATGVVLEEFVDNARDVSVAGAVRAGPNAFRVDLGTIAAGASASVAVAGTAQAAGTLTTSSNVTAVEVELNPSDNEALRGIDVSAAVPEPADLSLALAATEPDEDGRTSLTVTVENSGPGVGSNIQVQIDLPDGVVVESATTVQGTFDADTGLWTVGNLRDDLSRDLVLTVDGSEADAGDAVAEIVAVDEDDPDSTPGNADPDEDDFAVLTDLFGPPDPLLLVGRNGGDTLMGGRGDDTLIGLGGDDVLTGNSGNDRILGNTGDDSLNGGRGDDKLFGGLGDDTIVGGDGNDTLSGSFGDDELIGGAGDDVLKAGFGRDLLDGGLGNDTLSGSFGRDTFRFDDAEGLDTVSWFAPRDDLLDVSAFGFASQEDALATAQDAGRWDVGLDLDGDGELEVLLTGLFAKGLEADNFLI